MKIKMLKAAAGPEINLAVGQVLTVDEETAQAYIDAGAAVSLDEPKATAPKKATKAKADGASDAGEKKEVE